MQEDKHKQLHIDLELNNDSVWRMMDKIRGNNESIKHQIVGLLTYKYLSENFKNNSDDIGYNLDEDLYYENLLINKGNAINILKKGIDQITHQNDNIHAADVFYDLFDFIDFENFNDNNVWLLFIENVEKLCSQTRATIGEIIISVTKYDLSKRGIKSGELKPREEMIKLITTNQKDVKNIYDPYTDEATLLAEIGNIINVENYYGQHPDREKCVLAKMTLLANDVNYKNIFIKCNDISEIINWDVKFDLCVSMPPINLKKFKIYEDERFKRFTPRRSEFAYLLDMFYNLDNNGTIKMIVADGVLFSSPDKNITKYLVDNELISSIIGLPEGLLDTARIQTALITINKKPTEEGIYYLNIRNAETNRLGRKIVSIEDIDKYVKLLSTKEEQELISKIVIIDDIRENDYNLSINRYVDSEILEPIDIKKTILNINEIKKELKQVDEKLNEKIGGLF